jgi:anti-anti-sigma factor
MTHTVDRSRKILVVNFPGDVISTNAEALKSSLHPLLNTAANSGWDCLEADLTAAKMIDSVGLNFLVTVIKTVTAQGKKMRIVATSPNVLRSLKFTRLDQLAEVVRR